VSDRTAIQDQSVRERALDPARSFIVQAPAGSGKTELLIRRYLTLYSTVGKPEEILAITFTRKAAGEMRERVLEKLPDAAEVAHRLRIMTIDAFCASLTRQMPVLARFGGQPEIVEDAAELYREAAFRLLKDLAPPATRLLAHLDDNVETAATLVASMLSKRDQWLRKTGAAPTRAELEAALDSERNRLFERARALDPRASEEFAREVLTAKGDWRKKPRPAPPEIVGNEPLRQALVALLAAPPERYSDAQWEALAAIVELLPLAAAELKLVFAERGAVDFTEVAQGAVRALGTLDDPTDLLLALDHRIHHVLVDEFQDTSVSQWELLNLLTAGWQPQDGRTLFLVGDPMQSIYRFREAQVALFLDAWERGLGTVALEPLTLKTNFRSQPGLVAWFNAAFPRILPAQADRASGAVPYAPKVPAPDKRALAGEAVTWEALPDRGAEAARVVALVRGAEGRAAILVRNRASLAEIVPALKRAGVRYRAIEIEHLGEKQVVQDLYALTRALTHLGDRIAWLAVLRAPWVGLTLEELLAVAPAKAGAQTVWEKIKDNLFYERLTRILGPAIADRERGSLRSRVEGVWHSLGGPACVADRTELEDAAIFLDELERLEEAGAVADPAALAESLERLYALPDVEAGDDDLQIMTIHKAKGLQFGTVIVPGLDKGPGRNDPPLFLWRELVSEKGIVLAPIKATGADDDPVYCYLRALDTGSEDLEAARLLYVAATRAENRLHLLGCVRRDEHGAPKRPHPRSLLGIAWDVASESIREYPSAASPEITAPPATPLASLRRLAPEFALPPPPPAAAWAPATVAREAAPIEFSWAGETARHVGTVVHRWLQRIAEEALEGWDAKRVESLEGVFARDLERRGVPAPELKDAAALVAAALANTVADDRGRWLLGPHPEAMSEYAIRTPSGRYVIDRTFTDEKGERWVVDFKTSRHLGANVEGFLDQERERYAAQLDAYAAALGGARRGLYFPLHRGWRAW
jgi:ATP-dependent exoDNAse (exonuclease V) beta subunit